MKKLLSNVWTWLTVKQFSLYDLWIGGSILAFIVLQHFWWAIILFIIGTIIDITILHESN